MKLVSITHLFQPLSWLLVVILLFSCDSSSDDSQTAPIPSSATQSMERVSVDYATGFSFRYEKGIRVLRIHPTPGDTTVFYLVHKSTDMLSERATESYVEIPIENIMLTSTAHVAMMDFLGAIDKIGGVANAGFVQNKVVQTEIEQARILDIGNDQDLNTELIVSSSPEVISTVGALGLPQSGLGILAETGVNILPVFEWQETSLLARAEWVKVFAALVGKEEVGQQKFQKIAENYEALAQIKDSIPDRPRVLYGTPYKGIWYVPGGKSFVAGMLMDAGASYAWFSDSSAVTLPLALEAVYPEALEAEYWLVSGAELVLPALLGLDERFQDFKPAKEGNVYANNLQMKEGGGNNIYEKGIMEPDMILADIIKLLHPGILPEHNFQYYRKLE